MIESEKELLEYVKEHRYNAIVVEGYDGVGKGRVLRLLSEELGITPYRPDYNLWQSHDHRKEDRWKVSGFFWDVYSHFYSSMSMTTMLFDRGVLSGAVYNHDMSIARDYKKMLRDMKVLHILVSCNEEDYRKFSEIRNVDVDIDNEWIKYLSYTASYLEAFELAGVDYIRYKNHFNENDVESNHCISCGHYNYGWCRHPNKNCRVDGDSMRCELSKELEVQDRDATEMQCV